MQLAGHLVAGLVLFIKDAIGTQQVTNARPAGGQDAHILAGTTTESLVCRVAEGIIGACYETCVSTRESMRNQILPAMLLSTASFFFPLETAYAAGDVEAGKVKAYTCTGCHGIPGYNNIYPTYKVPKIGGQNYQYLTLALNAYRNGERGHPTMELQAQSLSEQDIEDVSAYFSSLDGE
jgi:cytochrome c553